MQSNDNQLKRVALFVCHDLVGLLMVNILIPRMKRIGFEPVLFNTGANRNRKFRIPTPPVVSAFNVGALENIIMPFVEQYSDISLNLSYKQLAEKYQLHYQDITDVNDPAFVRQIANDKNLVGGMSVRFLQIFEDRIIRYIQKKGFMWNLHSGLLGDYKGLLTPYRAIVNGEKEYGVTLHETAPGVDEGAVIAQGKLPLDPYRSILDLYMDTVPVAVDIVIDALDCIRRQTRVPKTAQNAGDGAYYPNPTAAELCRFEARGIYYADSILSIRRIAETFVTPDHAVSLEDLLIGYLVSLPRLRA